MIVRMTGCSELLHRAARKFDEPRALLRLTAFLATALVALATLCGGAALARGEGSVTLPGGPLIVSVGSLGECQSRYPDIGFNFYPPSGTIGDCGFFLSFPATSPNPPALQHGGAGTVFGFDGIAGPRITFATGGVAYTPIVQYPTTGSGIAADPYLQVTSFKASIEGRDYALINVFTSYVSGAPQFTSTYEVQNVTGTPPTSTLEPAPAATLFFHASAAGDLLVANNDVGRGFYQEGPPDFIGGQNAQTGTVGGFVAAAPPALPWTSFEVGEWDSVIWKAIRSSTAATPVFADTIDTNLIDNGVGVSWDQYLESGLPAGQRTNFSIINRAQVPSTLELGQSTQSLLTGQTATINVSATDNVGTPYAGRSLVYSINGANPSSGSVTTNASGAASISYVGAHAGLDTVHIFLDLPGTGVAAAQDPEASAEVVWTPTGPTASVPTPPAIGASATSPRGSSPRSIDLVGPVQMYFAGLTVPGRSGVLRLKRIVLLGTRSGESLSLRCRDCLGAPARLSATAHASRVVFVPRHMAITKRSHLEVVATSPGLVGRFKVYGIDVATASAKVLRQGCMAPGGTTRRRCTG
jgi:hypothetical protein